MGKLDKYHYHEIIDRAHVANDHFHEYVENHPAVMSNKELKEKAEQVTSIMYEFYNLCGHYINKKDRATNYQESEE